MGDVPPWQSWEKAALDSRFRVLAVILCAIAIPVITLVVVRTRRAVVERELAESRPRVVNDGPPEFLTPFRCDVKAALLSGETWAGETRAGEMQARIRNTGNSVADNVVSTLELHFVPEHKTGMPAFDQIPAGDCSEKPFGVTVSEALAAGQESRLRLPNPIMILPPHLTGAGQLYGVSCVYYADSRSGGDHASCDTYRFAPAGGSPVFMCDGKPRTGKFLAESIGNCGT